ncbi:monooxygenase [Ectopseudomonas mendocina]|uniref:Monooxygenase n=1 Tax=Ectopseudomonas mendocina TaxID=300 RepID=A0ABZ2RNL1_ECTME
MAYLLQIDFPHQGPWGADMSTAFKELAESIAAEPGLIWKLWTENQKEGVAGGIYLFSDQASAEAYLHMHSKRLSSFGVHEARSIIFEINEGLSRIDQAPL